MKSAHALRGAALPETALVLTATLAMFFGIIQIGVIGYLQLMVDGAAFIAAHEYAIGNSAYIAWAQRPFPLMGTPVTDVNNPDITSVPVNYNTSNTTNRQGGVSLIRTSHAQMTVLKNAPGGLLGVGIGALSNVSVHGSAIEPYNRVSNSVYDVNGNGYGGSSSQLDYYGNVQNAPANYVSMQEMTYCQNGSFSAQCPSVGIRALGSAEFLDHDNWNRTNLGVGPYTGSYTFGEMLCHEQKYAQAAATVFVPVTTTSNLPVVNIYDVTKPVGQIYSWDYITSTGGGYTQTESAYGQYPLHPYLYC